jgi:hypothetical protein
VTDAFKNPLAALAALFPQGTFSSLHVRNYRLYYLGQIISTSGTFMQTVPRRGCAQPDPLRKALGLATALQYLPILLLGPYAAS